MQASPSRNATMDSPQGTDREWANEESSTVWPDTAAGRLGAKDRLARLVRALETDVIPRLVQAHRPAAANPQPGSSTPLAAEVDDFVRQVLQDDEREVNTTIAALRERGASVEWVFLELFTPTARKLGGLWDEDRCDFSAVTVALGRLQRLMRELSPAFGTEVQHPANGRRALFVQPRDELHSFGLSMVAEFFRRDGWDVIGGVGGAVASPADKVRDEWVDVIGFSVGTDSRLPWLRDTISAVRGGIAHRGTACAVGRPALCGQPQVGVGCGRRRHRAQRQRSTAGG